MSDLKDHAWSAVAGVTGVGAGVVAFGSAYGGFSAVEAFDMTSDLAVIVTGFTAGVAGIGAIYGGAIAVDDIKDQAEMFRPSSGFGAAALSLAAVFGAANHFGLFEYPEVPAQAGQEDVSVQHISEGKRADAAQAFNETNTDDNAVEASVDGQGHYVLTVKAPKPAL